MASSSFGIDFGERNIRIADAQFSNGKFELNTIGEELSLSTFFSDDTEKTIELQADILGKLCKDLKISKRNVNAVIPDAYCFSQVMEFASLNQKELLSAVKYQADQFIPLPIDQVVFDLEVIKENSTTKKNTILIIASPKKIIERVEKTIEIAGLIPDSLESELSAISRFFSSAAIYSDAQPSSYLIVNFGFSTTSLYLIGMPGGIITELRSVKTGFDLFIKELKLNLELADIKALELLSSIGFEKNGTYDLAAYVGPLLRDLMNEIGKFVIIAKEKHSLPVKKIFLFNYDNAVHGMDKKFSELLQLPVESLLMRDVLVNNPISQSYANRMSSFIAAINANNRQ